MAIANFGAVCMEAWDRARALSAYGYAPLTVAWYRGEAHVRIWSFRTGAIEWRRMPSRDVSAGSEPKPQYWDPFMSNYLFRALR